TGMCTCRRRQPEGGIRHRYLGRYLKKPPIAASRLAHYNDGGASLSFRYLDHKTGETATETLTQRELVARLKQHIPEKFFKMVRYFGFLANRVCGRKLPQVYRALGMDKPETSGESVLCTNGETVPES
ncbi:hypothetical protein L445_05432, partial [Klebsiella pneumoniae BIDMC 16]